MSETSQEKPPLTLVYPIFELRIRILLQTYSVSIILENSGVVVSEFN